MMVLNFYKQWLQCPWIDLNTKEELKNIEDHPLEIEDRFYKALEFGTGGIRGILGAGRNRINIYTIYRITKGVGNYLLSLNSRAHERGVVIAYDSRHQSKELALLTATTFIKNGIKVYLFKSICPTPLLSFAICKLKAIAGVVITASHNPPEYNGYKVYGEDGGQVVPSIDQKIKKFIEKVEELPSYPLIEMKDDVDKIIWIEKEIEDQYISCLKNVTLNLKSIYQASSSLRIVYTPLHGVGNKLVQRILSEIGFSQVDVVPEQEHPHPDFITVKSPNPEDISSFELALAFGKEKQAHLIVATDPDADRVGVVVRDRQGNYKHLTGNQVGILLLYYLLSGKMKQGKLRKNYVVLKTIVTSQMGLAIADDFGVETIETHTGFKFIAEQIHLIEKEKGKLFLFGYEESCGYLVDTFIRDKDGIMSTLLICEMAAHYYTQNLTLYDVLQILYQQYGTFLETVESRTFDGPQGKMKMEFVLNHFRNNPSVKFGSSTLTKVDDYERQKAFYLTSDITTQLDLPKANVLRFTLDDGSCFCLRPSGTEPKLKIYFSVKDISCVEARRKLSHLVDEVLDYVDNISESLIGG